MILFLNLLKNALKKSASTQILLNNYDFYTTYVTYLGGGSLENFKSFLSSICTPSASKSH